ncbi:MAG TPA: hypothetical protein VGI81_07245 [Tepidisphaeraceae bacterium]|jgi:PAS domain-containing protein
MTPPEYVAVSREQMRLLDRTGRIGPYEKGRTGSRSWFVFAGAALGDGAEVKYCIDITDRKRAEEALRVSEARSRSGSKA